MRVNSFAVGPLGTNCYVIDNDGVALVIDPGGDPEQILNYLEDGKLDLECIINTHLHCDHTYGNALLSKSTGAPVLAHEADFFLLDTPIGRGGPLGLPLVEAYQPQPLFTGSCTLAGMPFEVIHTPGHSPGSITLYAPGLAFVGDLLFAGSIGRTDLPGGDLETLLDCVRRKIFTLPETTVIYPGHGPQSRVADEKRDNPFFN